jgi:hypothetical protein
MEETDRKVATNTIGYTRKQAGKEWFDEECEKVNEEQGLILFQVAQILKICQSYAEIIKTIKT